MIKKGLVSIASFQGEVELISRVPIYGAKDTFSISLNRAPMTGKFTNEAGNLDRAVGTDDVVLRLKTDPTKLNQT